MVSTNEFEAVESRPVTPAAILARKLRTLIQDIENSRSVNREFISELRGACELASGIESYAAACTTDPSEGLSELASKTARENWDQSFISGTTEIPLEQEMLSGHVEGQFLKMLVAATGARQVLEIGMFTGYSALAIAEGLPPNGRVTACELDEYTAEFARNHFKQAAHGSKIHVEVGPASETLTKLAERGETFDFVFIDADKTGYLNYFYQLLNTPLLKPGALICVDNTLLQGEPYASKPASENGHAIALFNRAVACDPRVEQVLVPIRDGVTLIRRIDR